jgi:methionyl-tRNA synthetase
VEGKKLGKSQGNGVDPARVVNEFGIDATRYYLLRHIRTTRDGDYSHARLAEAYTSELADQLGNLVHRALALVTRYRAGIIPTPPAAGERERELERSIESASHDVERAFERFALHEALESIWRLVAAANGYVDKTAPWTLAKLESTEGAESELDRVLYTLLDVVRAVGQLLEPFLPGTSREILSRLSHPELRGGRATPRELNSGRRVTPGTPLFPKSRAVLA